MPNPTISNNIFLACQITGIYDVNRNEILRNDDDALIKDWCESLIALDLQGIIFHNNYSEAFCEVFSNKNIQFIRIDYESNFNPNVFRYIVYRNFLRAYSPKIKNLFVTDISDVVVIKNPFIQPIFTENPGAIFCGDEPKKLENEWMKSHGQHLRDEIKNYADFEENFKEATLLNCGIIGGNISIMLPFVEKLANIHQTHNHDNKTGYTGDMGAFNYLIRTQFNGKVRHGFPINTEFKSYQTEREDCWFRHK